jgi:hypothetical protein
MLAGAGGADKWRQELGGTAIGPVKAPERTSRAQIVAPACVCEYGIPRRGAGGISAKLLKGQAGSDGCEVGRCLRWRR